MNSTSHLHNTILHTTCALESTLNLYTKFWRRCWGLVCFCENWFFCLDWFYFSTSYFLYAILLYFYLFLCCSKKKKVFGCFWVCWSFWEIRPLLERSRAFHLRLIALAPACAFYYTVSAPTLDGSTIVRRHTSDWHSSANLRCSIAVHFYAWSHLSRDQAH